MNSTKDIMWFAIYGMVLLHVYAWMIWPEFVEQGPMWKWDIFMVLLFAPIFYLNSKDDRKN